MKKLLVALLFCLTFSSAAQENARTAVQGNLVTVTQVNTPCCGKKPVYNDPAYASFTGPGQVAVITWEETAPAAYVVGIVNLAGVNTAPTGAVNWNTPIYHNPSWTFSKLGALFGTALDEQGNIYVAATTFYDTKAVGFGGSYGSIYKIANGTGAVTLLRNLPATPFNTSLNPAGIGNIAYSCDSHTLFASDLDDGRIYQLDPNSGGTLAVYDHGVHLTPPIPDDPSQTYTPLRRRVVGLRVYQQRLEFSDWVEASATHDPVNDNHVWSVALNSNGIGFVNGSEHLEVTLPPLASGGNWSNPVVGIGTGLNGHHLFAERSFWINAGVLTSWAHESRLLEYGPPPNWTASPVTKFQSSSGHPTSCAGAGAYDYATADQFTVWGMWDALRCCVSAPYIYGIEGSPPAGGNPMNSVVVDANGDTSNIDKKKLGSLALSCPACVTNPDVSITGPDTDCQSPSTYCVNNLPAGATIYGWSVTGGTFTVSGPNCISVSWNLNGPYAISVTYVDTNGCKSTISRQVKACPTCCDTPVKAVVTSVVATTANHYNVTTSLTGPSGANIRQVTATIVSAYQQFSSATCGTAGPVASWISGAPPAGTFVSYLPPFYREVKWTTSTPAPLTNAPFSFEIVVPPGPPADCADSIAFCVRWEFTTADCHTCETTTCYTIRRGILVAEPVPASLPNEEVRR